MKPVALIIQLAMAGRLGRWYIKSVLGYNSESERRITDKKEEIEGYAITQTPKR
jgi:hypothetical protein